MTQNKEFFKISNVKLRRTATDHSELDCIWGKCIVTCFNDEKVCHLKGISIGAFPVNKMSYVKIPIYINKLGVTLFTTNISYQWIYNRGSFK